MKLITKLLAFYFCAFISFISCHQSAAKLSLPMIHKWNKRTKEGVCKDPTEPFQCLGSNVCISLQYLCDGQPNDCPNNSDESEALCIASRRPPKDSVRRFLTAQYSNYGTKYIEYLFGAFAAKQFEATPNTLEIIDALSSALIVSPTIEQFAVVFKMDEVEKFRFINVLESLNNGRVDGLPKYVVDSTSEGLNTLTDKLIKTGFLNNQ